MGIPVVTTLGNSILEIIEHKKTGFVLDKMNPKQIANEIKKIMDCPELRNQVSIKAHSSAVNRFDIRDIAKELDGIYVKLSKKAKNSNDRK